jgi:tRNA nucleotidyltransferase (CCA-adding enzyme)
MSGPTTDRSLRDLLEGELAPAAQRALKRAARWGREADRPVYLVGGPVRDLLLGRPTADVDLMVEGGIGELAATLAKELHGSLRRYPEFRTASISAPGGLEIDLAEARAETYSSPGALPSVEPGSLAEDLARRDFSINALALRLAPDAAPALIDLHAGRVDLDRRRLRVLHERSFVDDPTRILRGVRFEIRLGFRFDRATEVLARAAVSGGAIDRLSGSRLLRDLGLLLDEDGAPSSLARLAELGLLSAVDPHLDLAAPAPALLDGLADGLSWHRGELPADPSLEPWRAYLTALIWSHPSMTPAELTDRLGLAGSRRDRLVSARGRLAAVSALLADSDLPPHRLSAELSGLDAEELLVLRAALPSSAARVGEELLRHRRLELGIGGGDLLAHGHAPGPAIGRALAATREARLDGRIDETGELEYALAELAREEESR